MQLYLLTQNETRGYDTFDSIVVAAHSPADAVTIHPENDWVYVYVWASNPDYVSCKYIGEADESVLRGVVLASFNAG